MSSPTLHSPSAVRRARPRSLSPPAQIVPDAGRPPGHRRTITFATTPPGAAAALGFADLPSSPTSARSDQHSSGPAEAELSAGAATDSAGRRVRPGLPHRPITSSTKSAISSGDMSYSSWSAPPLRPDVRHGSSRVFTFMPSSNRVPVPPAAKFGSPKLGFVFEHEWSPPILEERRLSRDSSSDSTTTSPSGETYFRSSSDSGDTYFTRSPPFHHRATFASTHSHSQSTVDTSPGNLTPGCGGSDKPTDARDGMMSAYEPREVGGELLPNASIGRSVDDALSALLGATSLVRSGLGSAALVIGPVDGLSGFSGPSLSAASAATHERDPTRRPSPPPSRAARTPDYVQPSGLITLEPGARPQGKLMSSTMNARPRAIRAEVVPPMMVPRGSYGGSP